MVRLLLVAALIGCAWSATLELDWRLQWRLAAPDGFSRPVITVNGEWPPPTIEVTVNDTIIINVHNDLGNETTSLHFHGLTQRGNSAADGAVGIGQCGIYPGGSFRYEAVAFPAGTHWWHSHEKGQYPDGMRGKLIVHDPEWEAGLNVDEQVFLSVSDWWHTQAPFLIHDYLSPENTNGFLPTPDAMLLDDSRDPPELELERGKRYLLRIVSFAGLVCNHFHIAGHSLVVVAIDGIPVHAAVTETIVICAGQSYDVIVQGTPDSEADAEYIVKMQTDMLTGPIPSNRTRTLIGKIHWGERFRGISHSGKDRGADGRERSTHDRNRGDGRHRGGKDRSRGRRNISARAPQVTGYDDGSVSISPTTLNYDWAADGVLDDASLVNLGNEPLYRNVTQHIFLKTNQVYYEGIGTRIGVGNQPWTIPKVPTLLSAFTTGSRALDWVTYGPGAAPYVLRPNEYTEIYMENPQPYPHPMHLHGHYFQIAGRGLGTWDGSEDALYKIPAKRNNIVVPPNGWILIRFITDNPGVWFFHCHIDLHLMGGMAVTLIEAPDLLQREQSTPVQNIDGCAQYSDCSVGACNCKEEELSEEQANEQCNSIFNTFNPANFGALVVNDSVAGTGI